MNTLPKYNTTDVLTYSQLEYLAKKLLSPSADTGRPAYTNLDLLPGILKVLRSGMRWRDLNRYGYPTGITHRRRLRFWERRSSLRNIWSVILKKLYRLKRLDLRFASIDGSLIPSFDFTDTTGYFGKYHKVGTKISTLVDFLGTPFNIIFAKGNKHDAPFAIPTISNNPVGKPETILADKGYDSNKLRTFLTSVKIHPNITPRNIKGRKSIPDYNIPLGKMRFKVERTNAWIKSFRRLHFRFDYTLTSFKAFTYLALIVICLRKLM